MKCVDDMVEEGRAEVEKRNPESSGRYFHSIVHTRMVMCYVNLLGIAAFPTMASSNSRLSLREAAAWHDVEQRMGPRKNEEESARLAELAMQRLDFFPDEIEVVKNLILATKVEWIDGMMHQEAEKMGLAEKILADADLCYLGADTEEFIKMVYRMMAELAKKPVSELTDDEKLTGWKNQINFMTGRSFLTSQASFVMGLQLSDNLTMAKRFANGYLK
jgi:predicted metal-dependent HD superfamily phosphohydrolase